MIKVNKFLELHCMGCPYPTLTYSLISWVLLVLNIDSSIKIPIELDLQYYSKKLHYNQFMANI